MWDGAVDARVDASSDGSAPDGSTPDASPVQDAMMQDGAVLDGAMTDGGSTPPSELPLWAIRPRERPMPNKYLDFSAAEDGDGTEARPFRDWNTMRRTLAPGDTVLIRRADMAAITTRLELHSDGEGRRSESGTADARISFVMDPAGTREQNTFSGAGLPHGYGDRSPIFYVDGVDYIDWWDFVVDDTQLAFELGEDNETHHHRFFSLDVTVTYAGDSISPVSTFFGGQGSFVTLDGFRFVAEDRHGSRSPSGVFNNNGIEFFRTRNYVVRNGIVDGFWTAFHHKHANAYQEGDVILVENVLMLRAPFKAMNINANHATFRNLICLEGPVVFAEASGVAGGRDNLMENVTIVDGELVLDRTEQGDATGNTLRNVLQSTRVMRYNVNPAASSHNLVLAGPRAFTDEGDNDRSLEDFQSTFDGLEAGSVTGTPTFMGGTLTVESPVQDFALAPGSAGVGEGVEGHDIGADVAAFDFSDVP